MTMFTYNTGVPFATNNPSNDQPQMLINTVSNNGIWNVDHVGFNSTGIIGNPNSSGGQHLRVSFNGKNAPAYVPSDPLSVLYTVSGVATTNSEMRFLNALNVAFPVSLIRAYGVFDTNGNIVGGQAINLSCAGFTLGNAYTMNITSGAITGATYGVLAFPNQANLSPGVMGNYVINSMVSTQFFVGFRPATASQVVQVTGFTCIVFQL